MGRRTFFATVALAGALASGCAALNPYDEHTYCRATDERGRCLDVVSAYTEAVGADKHLDREIGLPRPPSPPTGPGAGAKPPNGAPPLEAREGASPAPPTAAGAELSPREQYLAARDARLAELLREPETPMLAPPKLLRVLILPYKERTGDFDELFLHRYTYVKVESSDFLLADDAPGPR